MAALLLLIGLPSCATTPKQRQFILCPDCQSDTWTLANGFELSSLARGALDHPDIIHLYLEGDGIPWWYNGRQPAANPNSKQLTSLKLMTSDPFASIYLNRPCYGFASPPKYCTSDWWTFGRYSTQVVDHLNKALSLIKARFHNRAFVLIGHSGGGSLALLLAHQRQDIAGVITLAANLDHHQWTRHFGYTPLFQSMNPIDLGPLPAEIERWHLVGKRDQQVPAHLTLTAASRDPFAHTRVEENFDHLCCWQHIWLPTLRQFRAQIDQKKD